MKVKIPVSIGELFDKISILEIKKGKITQPDKLLHVLHEYKKLIRVALKIDENFHKKRLYKNLKKCNSFLWEVEDAKREHERNKDFGEKFIYWARQVYIKNDERAKIKSSLNKYYKSDIVEVKSHKKY